MVSLVRCMDKPTPRLPMEPSWALNRWIISCQLNGPIWHGQIILIMLIKGNRVSGQPHTTTHLLCLVLLDSFLYSWRQLIPRDNNLFDRYLQTVTMNANRSMNNTLSFQRRCKSLTKTQIIFTVDDNWFTGTITCSIDTCRQWQWSWTKAWTTHSRLSIVANLWLVNEFGNMIGKG